MSNELTLTELDIKPDVYPQQADIVVEEYAACLSKHLAPRVFKVGTKSRVAGKPSLTRVRWTERHLLETVPATNTLNSVSHRYSRVFVYWIWDGFSTKLTPALQSWKPDERPWFLFFQTHAACSIINRGEEFPQSGIRTVRGLPLQAPCTMRVQGRDKSPGLLASHLVTWVRWTERHLLVRCKLRRYSRVPWYSQSNDIATKNVLVTVGQLDFSGVGVYCTKWRIQGQFL